MSNNRSFWQKLSGQKKSNNNVNKSITNNNLNKEMEKQKENSLLQNANIPTNSSNNISDNSLNNNKPNNSLNNKPNNSLNNKPNNSLNNKPNTSLNNKPPNNSLNNKPPNNFMLNRNVPENTVPNVKSIKNIYNDMDNEEKTKMIRLIFDKHSFMNLKERLTKKKQTTLIKQAKKATIHTLTKSEKKKICVNYKVDSKTKKLHKKMKQNENNAQNKIFNKVMKKN